MCSTDDISSMNPTDSSLVFKPCSGGLSQIAHPRVSFDTGYTLQEIVNYQSGLTVSSQQADLIRGCRNDGQQDIDVTANLLQDAHDKPITAMQWSPVPHKVGKSSSAILATASLDKRIRLWRAPFL